MSSLPGREKWLEVKEEVDQDLAWLGKDLGVVADMGGNFGKGGGGKGRGGSGYGLGSTFEYEVHWLTD